MTVLVVEGSTVVAFGMEGMGLESWAWSANGPVRQVAAIRVKVQILMRLQVYSF
jgi:hypothetical protein